MRNGTATQSPSSQILKVLVPVLLSCFCVVGTALFSDTGNSLFSDCLASPVRGCVQHYLQLYWGLTILLWGALLILSSLAPHHVNQHMPLLLIWTVWISLRSEFQLGRLADAELMAAERGVLSSNWITAVLLLCALLSLLIRHKSATLVLCLAEIVFLATMPKSSEIKITLMILQTVYFCALYFLSLLLMPVKCETTYVLNTIMGSIWALWINDMLHLTIAVLAYMGVCLFLFAVQYESTQVWAIFTRVVAPIGNEEMPTKSD